MFRGTIALVKVTNGTLQRISQSSTPLLLISAQKHHLVASTEAKPDLISKNLSFRAAYDSPFEQQQRPLVLLYSWLVAKAKHMHKYGDFYLQKGYDVLHIKVNPMQLLLPSRAQDVVGQVVDFMQQPLRLQQPVLVHGFSVGGYLYGETLVHIMQNESVRENMRSRIQGQILDSPVNFEGIPFGVSRAVTEARMLQNLINATIAGYLALMKNTTMVHYVRSQRTFEENPLNIPTLFLYSLADLIGPPGPIEEVMSKMRVQGNKVYAKCWSHSKHVSHFHVYPVEYIDMMTSFLKEIGLLSEQSTQSTSTHAEMTG